MGIGYAFAPFFRGLLQGVEDYEVESAAREIMEENEAIAEMRKKEHRQKTEISDCRKCWCDQCARLEDTPVPLYRLRGRYALQALRRSEMRKLYTGLGLQQRINEKRSVRRFEPDASSLYVAAKELFNMIILA